MQICLKEVNKRGISLIVLIVTIIVIIILAAVVVLTITKNNSIENAKEAAFKEDVRVFQDELNMYIAKEYTKLQGQRDDKITKLKFDEIKEYIESFSRKYENKIAIDNDVLVYIGKNEKEKQWFSSVIPIKEKKWDLEWNYKMGKLEENEFLKVIQGSTKDILNDDGETLTIYSNGSHLLYHAKVTTTKKAEAEVILSIKEFAATRGFRFTLSNGTYGCHISIRNGGLYVDENTTNSYDIGTKRISDLEIDREYKIKLYFDENDGCKVYLDEKLIYDEKIFSYCWITKNNIIQQDGGTTVLKSVKYKFYD